MRQSIRKLCKHLSEIEIEVRKWSSKHQAKVIEELIKRTTPRADNIPTIESLIHELQILCVNMLPPTLEDYNDEKKQ